MYGWMVGMMDDTVDGWMVLWVDGLMDGWKMDEWKDRETEGCKEERVEGGTHEWKEVGF